MGIESDEGTRGCAKSERSSIATSFDPSARLRFLLAQISNERCVEVPTEVDRHHIWSFFDDNTTIARYSKTSMGSHVDLK